ncbi:hypothetical protein ACQR5T_09775 [Xanthomonas oryzae pv. oryzicola]|uniref:hypothetical protein n=1 Tax=Xanthomonas oryzae TaxID=347 RepID=UPI0003FEFB69|nr:hypothetical protein [Xanthomonas oryzae]
MEAEFNPVKAFARNRRPATPAIFMHGFACPPGGVGQEEDPVTTTNASNADRIK